METKNENSNVCGYCGSDMKPDDSGLLIIADKNTDDKKEVCICNECVRRLKVKIALNNMPKDDIKSFNDFLGRNNK